MLYIVFKRDHYVKNGVQPSTKASYHNPADNEAAIYADLRSLNIQSIPGHNIK